MWWDSMQGCLDIQYFMDGRASSPQLILGIGSCMRSLDNRSSTFKCRVMQVQSGVDGLRDPFTVPETPSSRRLGPLARLSIRTMCARYPPSSRSPPAGVSRNITWEIPFDHPSKISLSLGYSTGYLASCIGIAPEISGGTISRPVICRRLPVTEIQAKTPPPVGICHRAIGIRVVASTNLVWPQALPWSPYPGPTSECIRIANTAMCFRK